ncbi:E3 ubiquitin-protein ligase rnf213-alpha-like isoform 2-T2 [Pholidichthys leucotaenia]
MFMTVVHLISFKNRCIMFCPECGNKVEKSFKFCPACGFKLLTQNRAPDGATSAHEPSKLRGRAKKRIKTRLKKSQKTLPAQGQRTADNSDSDRDGAAPKNESDNTDSSTIHHQHLSDKKLAATPPLSPVLQTCKEKESLTAVASESKSQPCSQKPKEDIPEAQQIPPDKFGGIHSETVHNSTSSLTSARESGSTAYQSSEATLQKSKSKTSTILPVSQQDDSKKLSNEKQNLPGKQNKSEHSFTNQSNKNEEQEGEESCSYSCDQNTEELEHPAAQCPASNKVAKSSKAVSTNPNDKLDLHLMDRGEQRDSRDASVPVESLSIQEHQVASHSLTTKAEGTSQKGDQDQVPKDIKEKSEKAVGIQGQRTADNSDSDRDGAAPKNESDNTDSSTIHHQHLSDKELAATPPLPPVLQTCKEKESLTAVTSESKSQPCSQKPKEDIPEAQQIPPDKFGGIHSETVHNSTLSLTSARESGSTAYQSSEATLQKSKSKTSTILPVSQQDDSKKLSNEKQNPPGKQNKSEHSFTNQSNKNEEQEGEESCSYSCDQNTEELEHPAAQCPASNKVAKSSKAVSTNPNDKLDPHLMDRREQWDNRDVSVPVASLSIQEHQVASHNLTTKAKLQATQNSGHVHVYFHALVSKDSHLDPENDAVILKSGPLFGNWNDGRILYPRSLGNNRYLVEGELMIPEKMIEQSIPYKYTIYKKGENEPVYETIYQKHEDSYINRCLSVRRDLLSAEGEWHQYDDVIHCTLKKSRIGMGDSPKDTVMKGREDAGREMLKIIFELLTTWNKQNVENFFVLLQQFLHTYSNPVLHDGMERSWGLQYGRDQVNLLLEEFLERKIIPKSWNNNKSTEFLLPSLNAGLIGLLIYNKHLKDSLREEQLSNLCKLLCLPDKQPDHFLSFWKDFADPLTDKKSIADVLELLCQKASQCQIKKWVLVIPLIHLLRGECKPHEPVPPVLNPQFDCWEGYQKSKRPNSQFDSYARDLTETMKHHAYLVGIDRLLVRSWMSLLPVEDIWNFISVCRVQVELLDILHCLQFSIKTDISHSVYKALKDLIFHLKETHQSERFDDKNGECCLKAAVVVLGSVCHHTKDPNCRDVVLDFLDLVCLIAKAYGQTNSLERERIQKESFWEALETMRKWRRSNFKKRLRNEWKMFLRPNEKKVWIKLLSVSFSQEEHTSSWREAFMTDFEGKLKQECPVDQIDIYCNMVEELNKTSPMLSSSLEKCALEAVEYICQEKSGKAVSELLTRDDITKFRKLLSAVVEKSWPRDTNGSYIEGEDLIFQHLINWQITKTVFHIAGVGRPMFNKLSNEAQSRITLGASAFRSVSEKFLSGQLQIRTLNQILQRKHTFFDLLKIDGLCDDGRCKDNRNMKYLAEKRKEEVEALNTEKELARSLLQICQELPEHVKVDFNGLESKLQNIDNMNLNEFMEVHTLDGQTPHTAINATYFNLCGEIHQMASKLHAMKDSSVFKVCWTHQVEAMSRDHSDIDDSEQNEGKTEIYTLDLVYSKIFQSCYRKYKGLYESLKSGDLTLEEIDEIFEAFKGRYEDLEKDFDIMCRLNPSDNRNWISGRVNQIRQYQDVHLVLESSEIIMDIKEALCPSGDFTALEKLLQMNDANFKKNKLNCIDKPFIQAKATLKGITDARKKCLQVLRQSEEFVEWVKKELKDINELKVFVDLASISAGENDLDVDQVACFHDAVLGYSSMLYGLEQDSDFKNFKDSLSELWKALKNDRDLPEKLGSAARHLEWLKTVRESHGSVEFSSLSLATSINETGIYVIKAQNQAKLNLETSLMLQLEDKKSKNLTYTYEDLKELQNKLMLMSGKHQQSQGEVECFTEVFDSTQRLAKAFLELHAAGNPLFKCWEAKIYCRSQSDPCISMIINFCKTSQCIHVKGDLVGKLTSLCDTMELFLKDWQNFMDKQRADYYYLNYFTADQIFYLCSVVTPTNMNAEIEDKALTMFSFIRPNCTASDVWRRLNDLSDSSKRLDNDISSAYVSLLTLVVKEEGCQLVVLKELEDLWNGYMSNEEIFFHDLLDIRSLGRLLQSMTVMEKQNQNEWEQPLLSEKKDNSLRRRLPKGLKPNRPNLIICPHNEVLTSSISLYMTSDYEPLPSYDEVLMCASSTSNEQVELFMRRCLTRGDVSEKIYTMLWADQLNYDASCTMEKFFQKLPSSEKNYTLVIICSSDKVDTYIPTAFSQYKTDFVPHEPLEKIQEYLSRHHTVTSDHRDVLFKGRHSVGIVSSHRAGVGKSLYVQRVFEKLEQSVAQGTAFKKSIRLTEHEVDNHKVLQSLYDTPKEKDLKVFHFDITSTVQKGLNEFIYNLFFLRYLVDSAGQMWHCSQKHLYIIELLESRNDQTRHATRLGQKEIFHISDVFPKVFCHAPKEVKDMEMQREVNSNLDTDGPLMDDEWFRSEAYQRPYQYLTRFYNNENLDNFTYQGIEGTHAKCLEILLIYCGIIDPSWSELRNFVWFLNLQLQDCENSDFCKFEFVGDILHGFKNFVVKFMILMSKDFATPSLCITDQSPGRQQIDISGLHEKDLAPFLIRKRWESKSHPYIFFNDDHMSMTFIGFHLKLNNQGGVDAINPLTKEVIEKNIMSQSLYTGLKLQKVPFNTDFDQLHRAVKIEHLCSVLGIKLPTDPDRTYELTTDNILKMMAIHMRFRCGIPVIIMGETGCGKTRLIKFMSELIKCGAPVENMKLVKVHGGTSSEMIYEKVREADNLARTNTENHNFGCILFFDEANTAEAVSSIKEVVCDKSVQGQQLDSQTGLQIIAACNPYRKHTDKMIEKLEASGLGYRVWAQETEGRLGSIPLRQLVYRVYALPPSMMPLVWDFGQLDDLTEQMYIEQIVQRQAKANSIETCYVPTISDVLSSSQKFMRERKDECSFVSLRDVERCMQVFVWFHKNQPMFAEHLKALCQQNRDKLPFSPASERVIWSLLMATGVCYQSCLESKRQYQETICKILPDEYKQQRIQQEIQLFQDLLLNGVPMAETIARNEALKENFFMMVVCIELRIPLFIVGKPGSSKSLSKTLVAHAMQGPASYSNFYKTLKQIHLISFQCSPHTTAEGIINTFKQCARFQESKNLDEYISVVVLDEIGLAEDSPKMPLKTLHPLLEEGCVDDDPEPHKRVGFIGISNWALDPAKMNRGIFVSRGDLNEEELIKSAEGICSSDRMVIDKIKHFFKPFAKAFQAVCKESKGFFGLRDFYSLIKMLFSITKLSNECPTKEQITGAVLRNFSGKDVEDVDVIGIFSSQLGEHREHFASVMTIDMVKQAISPESQMNESRYLLLLTKNYAALEILQEMFLIHEIHPEIIFGSSFPKDQEYTQICRNINRVKVCMETGQAVVLLNLQNLYESLYDALNQYYMTLGGQKYVDLGLGTHRVKCRVHQNFKLIVIEEKEVVYEQFPIPLINRLEKHCLDFDTVLNNELKDTARQLKKWVSDYVSLNSHHPKRQEYVPSAVFIGYHADTCSSVIMQVTKNISSERENQLTLDKAKDILLNCATLDSVVRLDKSRLADEEREHLRNEYVKETMHRSLGDYIVYHTQQSGQSDILFTEVTTFSKLLTASDTQQLQEAIKHDAIKLLSLQQFDTEYSFLKKIREFIGSTHADKVLIIQAEYDGNSKRKNIISSAKYSCINEINTCGTTDGAKTSVYFVIKLPRMEGGTSYTGFQGPWRSVHIDDLRRSEEFDSDILSLKNAQISDLFEEPPEATEREDRMGMPQQNETTVGKMFDDINLMRSCVQSAVSMLRDPAESEEFSTKRVQNLLTLLDESHTQGMFAKILRKRLCSLLKEYEVTIPNAKNWVLNEAAHTSALQEGGTFLHTLWRKIQAVVTPLLAYLVSVIDRDCNLDLLLDSSEEIGKLWLDMFGSNEMLPVPYVKMENKVLLIQSHVTDGHTMRCSMPFSWWIKDFLDELMTQTSSHENNTFHHFHELFSSTPLGIYMAKITDEKRQKDLFERYLEDFVCMTIKVSSDAELQLFYQALLSCIDEIQRRKGEAKLSLPHIHIAFHLYQSRLQNLSRLISLHPEVVALLQRNLRNRRSPEMVLDVYSAKACVELLEPPKLNTDADCQKWLRQVKMLQASLEMICSEHNTRQYGDRCKEILHQVSKGWKRLYILSLFVEHMLLGLNNENNQLRPLVLNHIETLGKALEENSDVKSEKGFQTVVNILKSCKQGATDQIFRFGLDCAVCLREPQEPVALPCHHIFCLTCIKNILDAGRKSCPTCRQQLPNDFQPNISEDIRASIKIHADFRQRSICFFIDLLSAVCFKDSTPPSKGVITHLLSYLRIETEQKQIHTKALSPFDESPDGTPVVRSVILKLLLKFSFDDVEEYLQQHLSSVEDSRIVNDEDKEELYALYINCLEDSIWEKMPQKVNKAEELQHFSDEMQFLHFFLEAVTSSPSAVTIQHLQHIARLRMTLTMAAQLISDRLSDNRIPDGGERFLNMVIKLCKDSGNDWYRVYLIRKLSEWLGVEHVQRLVNNPEFTWIFPEEIRQQDGGQMDQYLVYGQEYKAVRDAVAKAVVDGNVAQIEEVCEKCTSSPRNRTVFILLALFREVTMLYRSENTSLHPTSEQCEAFEELICGSNYLTQQEVKKFASALVKNKLGALTIRHGSAVVENTISELIIHLAAVLLTGNHPLLLPLKQLGLSPENMQNAFIPTMPDDMLAVAQAAIQQDNGKLTWYVCPNNHPCFVDMCGLPMERGKCLECGEEVGGESHTAMPGFTPVQLQNDRTRPGHILGDPEQRNNPDTLDTKNMSLTPFTLVRLVTHLAMLLGASEKSQVVQQIIHPPVQDACLFLRLHIEKDVEQLVQALGKGTDDTVTYVHFVLRSLKELQQTSQVNVDGYLATKASRNIWETAVATDVMTPKLKDLDQLLQEVKDSIRNDSRVSSNFIIRTAHGDDCTFLSSLQQDSPVNSSAVWSCRQRLSLSSISHIIEHNDQKKGLPLLWRFLQKEREFRHIKLLPDILILQKRLVRKYQNASEQIVGSITDFLEEQKVLEMKSWYQKHINTFLKTWNLLRVSVTSNEIKIPEEYCSENLDLNSDLQYLLPQRQGPGLCATALVSYLVTLHNELVHAVDSYTREDSSSYRVSVGELMKQHVIHYDVEKDLLPLVLSNCQYSLERGHETISQYDLPRIQQQILTRFLQGKPVIIRKGIPTLVNTQERDYETIFKAVKGKVPQIALSSLTRNAVTRQLDSYSDVCEAFKIVELLLGFLSMTSSDPKMKLTIYLCDILKMDKNIDGHLLQVLGRCSLEHCVSLWQVLSSLRSEKMLQLKRDPFSAYPAEYQEPLTEKNKTELKVFISQRNVDQWLLEVHEFLLLQLGCQRATDRYKPFWDVKQTVAAYMDQKEVEVPPYVKNSFPNDLLLSQITETWKYAITTKHELMTER